MKNTRSKGKITVLGLGPGDPRQLTLEAVQVIESAGEIWVRTARHPVVESLAGKVTVQPFDHLYEGARDLSEAYDSIVSEVLKLGQRPEGVVYAVPGHPLVAEETVRRLLAIARDQGIEVSIVAGLSFLEPAFAALRIDPLARGLQILDAGEFLPYASYFEPAGLPESEITPGTGVAITWAKKPVDPAFPALICQLDSRQLASTVKLILLEFYPPEHQVTLVSYAGVAGKERKREMDLSSLDHDRRLDHLTVLYVPPLDAEENSATFTGIRHVVASLRAPGGCPWDREQTHNSLKPYLIEEAYEVLDALDREDSEKLREELGDLLLQIVLHAQLATESHEFLMEDVFRGIVTKLVRRHPHVFGNRVVSGSAEVVRNWERIKQDEKGEATSSLNNVPLSLPALAYAQSVQRRAARVGFDWPTMDGVVDKILEEIQELKAAESPKDKAEEMGDVLFSVVNLARWLNVDAEDALRLANAKFKRRFQRMESLGAERGRQMKDLSLEQQEGLWEESKKEEESGPSHNKV